MRFTDLKDDALKCANYYPEDAKEKIDAVTDPETGRKRYIYKETKVLRCCLEDQHRHHYEKLDMCGTVACPFYKPNGTANQVRKERRNAVWFVPLSPEQEAKQMTPREYERMHK